MTFRSCSLFILFQLLCFIQPLQAAEQSPSDLSAALRVLWGLLAVIGILLILAFIARKRMSFLHASGKGEIQVLEVRHLMPKKALYLVSVRNQEFLLASGDDRLELIAQIQKTENTSFEEIPQKTESEENL
jgi:flagellar protein FliO/FliZ